MRDDAQSQRESLLLRETGEEREGEEDIMEEGKREGMKRGGREVTLKGGKLLNWK